MDLLAGIGLATVKEEPSSSSFLSMLCSTKSADDPTPGPSSSSEDPSEPEPKRPRLDQIPEFMLTAGEDIKPDLSLLMSDAVSLFPAPVKPSLNNRQLAYLAMKNANFMPLQTPHICDFIEHVFPYYASGDDKWKIKWRNALSGGVRTAKCDDRLFVTNSMWGSGLRMFYKMNMDRADYFEHQIKKWRQSYNEDNIHLSGLHSLEELELVASGEKGIDWVIPDPDEHMKRYEKSTIPDMNPKAVLQLRPEHCHPAAMALFSSNENSFQINGSAERAAAFIEEDEERQREKAELRRQRKNERVKCLVCSKMVCRKSLPRHLRVLHKFADADMMGYKLEELDRKMQSLREPQDHTLEMMEDVKPSLLLLDPPVVSEAPAEASEAPVVSEEVPPPEESVEDEEIDVKPDIEALNLRTALAEISASTSTDDDLLDLVHTGGSERVEITVGPAAESTVDPEDTVGEEENAMMELDFDMLEKVQQQWMIKNRRVHCRICNKRVSKKSLPRHLRTLHGLEEEQRQEYYKAAKIDPQDEAEDMLLPGDLPIDSLEDFAKLTESGDYDKETLKKMWRNRKVTCRLCCKLVNLKSRPRHLRVVHAFNAEQITAYNMEDHGGDKTLMMMDEKEEGEGEEEGPAEELECAKCQETFTTAFAKRFHEVQCGQERGGELVLEPEERETLKNMWKNRQVSCRFCCKYVNYKSRSRHLRLVHNFTPEQIAAYNNEENEGREEDEEGASEDCVKCQQTFQTPFERRIHEVQCNKEEGGDVVLATEEKEVLRNNWKNRQVSCRLCCKYVNYKSRSRHLRLVHSFTPEQIAAYNSEENDGKDEDEEGAAETDCVKCQQTFATPFERRIHEVHCSQETVKHLVLEPAEDVKPEICIRLGADGPACSSG